MNLNLDWLEPLLDQFNEVQNKKEFNSETQEVDDDEREKFETLYYSLQAEIDGSIQKIHSKQSGREVKSREGTISELSSSGADFNPQADEFFKSEIQREINKRNERKSLNEGESIGREVRENKSVPIPEIPKNDHSNSYLNNFNMAELPPMNIPIFDGRTLPNR
ncbi:hypothetical protein JTB14_004081 [Gonioctena quinquepunctata]|nr:hypothetical protein JTB14_004081 [Gonioctena quinquepunctata]